MTSKTGTTDCTVVFTLKHVTDDATEHYFCVDRVQPLGFEAFRDCLRAGRRLHPTVMWGTPCDVNGVPTGERVRMTFPVEFNERIPFYGLSDGGLVPPMYLCAECILALDRNVVAALVRPDSSQRPDARGERWLFGFLNNPALTLNPTLGGFEGSKRRTPTLEEFRSDVQNTARAIGACLPLAQVVSYSDEVLSRLHVWRSSFDARLESETRFLRAAAPLLKNRIATPHLQEVELTILKLARTFGLGKGFAVLAVLAVLYESSDGADWGAARAVLKPRDPYSEADAYNALADLRQLELLSGSRDLPRPAALLTADQGLALLWCGLGVRNVQVGAVSTRIELTPHPALFPRLPPERREALLTAV